MIPKHIFKSARFPDFRVGFQDRQSVARYIRYIQRDSGAGELVKNSFEFDDPLAITEQCSKMRNKSKYWGFAFCISFPAEETATWEPHLREIVDDMDKLQGCEYSLWGTHRDKKFLHLHGFLFNSTKTGRPLDLVKGGRLRPFAERWEDKLNARKTGRGPAEPQIPRDLLLMEERTGETPTVIQLMADVDLLVQRSQSWDALRLNAVAMGLTVQFREKDGRTVGVSFGNGTTQLGGRSAATAFLSSKHSMENKAQQALELAEIRRLLAEQNKLIALLIQNLQSSDRRTVELLDSLKRRGVC